jgi:ABC-type phosphate transport system substrate-binding protein
MSTKLAKTVFIALVALSLGLGGRPAPAAAAEGYKVIVHPSNPANSLSREQVMQYLLKKALTWPSGTSVAAVDLHKQSTTRGSFSREVLQKSVAAVTAYWQQQIFSGRAVPPPEKLDDAAVVAFVEANDGAIGYVSAAADVGNAKVVRLLD